MRETCYPDSPVDKKLPSYEDELGRRTWWEEAMDWLFVRIEDEYQKLVEAQRRPSENVVFLARKEEEEQTIEAVPNLLGILSNHEGEDFLKGTFLAKAVGLSSTQRLFGLAQVSPVVNQLLGLNLTRGRHTTDCMGLTAQVLAREAVSSPSLFDQLAESYQVELGSEPSLIQDEDLARRVKLIQHFVEYMRLHDLFTLAFHGVTHGTFFRGKRYDENDVLLRVLSGDPEYQEIAALYFEDKKTQSFYKEFGLQREVIRQIAEDAVGGSLTLAQLLKGKGVEGNILSLDPIAYIFRGISELDRVFGQDEKLPPHQRIKAIYQGMADFATALAEGKAVAVKLHPPRTISAEEFIPSNFVKLGIYKDQPAFIFTNPLAVYNLYLAHIMSRLYFSGSPLVRGTHRLIHDHYQETFAGNNEALISDLLTNSEEELLERDLGRVISIAGLGPESLLDPDSLPSEVKGWHYSSVPGSYSKEKFVFKDISATLVQMADGCTLPFNQAFPQLSELTSRLQEQREGRFLYLRHPEFS